MSRRPLDPRKVNVVVDDNALDPGRDHHAEVRRLLDLKERGEITVIVPWGVRDEALHPNTPAAALDNLSSQIFSLRVELNDLEVRQQAAIRAVLVGNAQPGKHEADAEHVFEALKVGGGYFVTHDRRINRTKLVELEAILSPSLWIVTPAEFFAIFDDYAAKSGR